MYAALTLMTRRRNMEQIANTRKDNRQMTATLFVFFVSGASSVLMGNLMGVVVAATVLLLMTILVSVFTRDGIEE